MDLKRIKVPSTGYTIAYDEIGVENPITLLLIPGGTGEASISTWAPLWERFSDKFHVVIVEGRGATLADKGPSGFSTEDIAKDFLGLLDFLKVDKVLVAGGSAGSCVGQHVCYGLGDRLLGGVLFIAGPGGGEYTRQTLTILSRLAETDYRTFALMCNILAFNTVEFENMWPMLRPNLDTVIPRENCIGASRRFLAVAEHDAREKLTDIQAPILVIAGECDRLMPPEYCKQLSDLLPNSEFVVYPNGSHMWTSLYQEPFYRMVREFLDKCVRFA